jgi:hypothetical protein
MEPINTTIMNTGIHRTPIKSSSAEPPPVKAVESISVRPEFVSPKGTIDAKSGVYVVQIRNASTEMLNFQYPNKKVVAEYVRSDNLVPSSETKSQGSSSATVVSGVNTPEVEDVSSTTTVSPGQINSNSMSSGVAPLGTSDT